MSLLIVCLESIVYKLSIVTEEKGKFDELVGREMSE